MTLASLTKPEIAAFLRVSHACLRRWRLEERGGRLIKVGSGRSCGTRSSHLLATVRQVHICSAFP
jgi:hypothetical protein